MQVSTSGSRGEIVVALLLVALTAATEVAAADGRLEINQACIADGCFSGDTAGFPVQITMSGSYVLTGDVEQSTANGSGISIQADNVTLDLNGFTLNGPGTVAGTGVQIQGVRVVVKNGSILNFGAGVNISGASDGHESRALDLVITTISDWAVRLGEYSEIRNCAMTTGGTAITTFSGAHIVGNRIVVDTVNANAFGIEASSDSIVRENIILNATGHGISGTSASVFASNTIAGSGQSGISVAGSGSIIVGNAVRSSQNHGFAFPAGANHLVRGNSAFASNLSGGAFTDYEACANCTFIDNHPP